MGAERPRGATRRPRGMVLAERPRGHDRRMKRERERGTEEEGPPCRDAPSALTARSPDETSTWRDEASTWHGALSVHAARSPDETSTWLTTWHGALSIHAARSPDEHTP